MIFGQLMRRSRIVTNLFDDTGGEPSERHGTMV